MHTSPSIPSLPALLRWLGCLVLAGSLCAETVIIESRVALAAGDWAYTENVGNWQNSSAKSSAAGLTPGTGSRFATADGAEFVVTPTLMPGGTYHVEVTHGTSSNIPTDLMVGILQGNCIGLPDTTTEFNQLPANTWRRVGTITVDPGVTTPTLTFTKLAGSSGTGQRFYMDAIQFINTADPCLSGPPQLATVNGPLAAGQTFVVVPNVATNATKITVFADAEVIGELTNGVVAGVNTVPTQPLVKGTQITVTQSDAADVESCRPATGALVGGGANPKIRVSLSIKQDITLQGPIGTNGGTPTLPLFFLAASGPVGGWGTAPLEGRVIDPGSCWQTVTFERGPDSLSPVDRGYFWANAEGSELQGDFGILDAIAFCLEDANNSGPYLVCIDNVMNGATLIQDFESSPQGTNALFMRPDFSGSTSPYLLAQPPGSFSPNVAVVTNLHADTGTNSLLANWQFKDGAPVNWLRLVAQGPGTPNPQVDLRLPISFRLLLLPVGVTAEGLSVTRLVDQTGTVGNPVTFSVVATGTGPFTYKWFRDDAEISGQTGNSYTIASAQVTDAGAYSVEVGNGTCSTRTSAALSVVTGPPGPIAVGSANGKVVLTWPGQAILEAAPDVTGLWNEVTGATSGFEVDPLGASQFYRLKR